MTLDRIARRDGVRKSYVSDRIREICDLLPPADKVSSRFRTVVAELDRASRRQSLQPSL